MRTLIDGYNLMYALGLLGKRRGPEGFRKARTRFLNDLAAAIGAVGAHQTTVVFDANADDSPHHLPRESTYKGMTIIYALEDENADARIERLIAAHSAPKSLVVVSTDQRIRQAAARRKARPMTAEAFWHELETPKRRATAPPPPTADDQARLQGPSPADAAAWLETFRDVADVLKADDAHGRRDFVPTDDEIARIEREVEDEFREGR
jgi:predicted RNA-binding protein with PIN domain